MDNIEYDNIWSAAFHSKLASHHPMLCMLYVSFVAFRITPYWILFFLGIVTSHHLMFYMLQNEFLQCLCCFIIVIITNFPIYDRANWLILMLLSPLFRFCFWPSTIESSGKIVLDCRLFSKTVSFDRRFCVALDLLEFISKKLRKLKI